MMGKNHPHSKTSAPFCVVVASNDEACLRQNLMASEMVDKGGIAVHVERGAASAALAYNHGIDATTAPVIVFAHQDVYFPPGWDRRLNETITLLEKQDPDWALLAPFGMSRTGEHIGSVWSSSLGRIIGRTPNGCEPAQSFDELVVILRRGSGLQFDTGLPGFHMYGTDIVQTARARGLGAYVCALPLVHNDGFHDKLRSDFGRAYHFMRRKWRAQLPLRSPVLQITRSGAALHWQRLRMWRSLTGRRAIAMDPQKTPQQYSAACGWE